MQGIITQVFETGDFSVWLPQAQRLVVAYGTVCDLSEISATPGQTVTVTVNEGKVLTVVAEATKASAKAQAAFRVAQAERAAQA